MDIIKLGRDMDKLLNQTCIKVEQLGEPDKDGAAWFYELDNDICGFTSCESNAEDISIPTISIAISLGDASTLTQEELLQLLEKNGDFWRATITAAEIDGSRMLFIQYKVMAESFKMEPEEFIGCIDHLLEQQAMFLE
jgi:hypothetical protein